MRTKMALAVLAASTIAAGNMSAFGGVFKCERTHRSRPRYQQPLLSI